MAWLEDIYSLTFTKQSQHLTKGYVMHGNGNITKINKPKVAKVKRYSIETYNYKTGKITGRMSAKIQASLAIHSID